jgi:transcriptional regulator with XRE-family HTH domain
VPARSPAHAALGRAIRSIREERGLSQEALGFESGLDRTYIGGIERGERNPSFESLLRVVDALDVPLSQVVERFEARDQRS